MPDDKIIELPDHSTVAFPPDMADADISTAISKHLASRPDLQAPPKVPKPAMDVHSPEGPIAQGLTTFERKIADAGEAAASYPIAPKFQNQPLSSMNPVATDEGNLAMNIGATGANLLPLAVGDGEGIGKSPIGNATKAAVSAAPKIARTGAVVAQGVGAAAEHLPVVGGVVKAAKVAAKVIPAARDVWAQPPVFPGAPLPEHPGVFPGAPLPEAPPKPVQQGSALRHLPSTPGTIPAESGEALATVGAARPPAPAPKASIYRDATKQNAPYAGEDLGESSAPAVKGAPIYRDATLDKRNIPAYAGEDEGVPAVKGEPLPRPVGRQAAPATQTPLAKGEDVAGQYGHDSTVKTSTSDLPTKYKLVEADALTPSHNADTFAPNEKYPAGVQERAYHTSKEAQARVIQQTQNYDPRYTVNTNPDAVNGPPIVTPDGTVLGGNSRTMSTQRLYRAGQGDIYKSYLRDNAAQFGLKPEAVDGMKNPVLVREVPAPGDVDQARRLGTELNKNMTGALGTSEKAVSAGRNITPQSLSTIAGMIDGMGPEAGIRDLLRDHGKDVLNLLIKDGAITERERPQFMDTASGGLSEEGKQFAERAMLGTVVDDPTLMDRAPKNILHKIGGSLADITSVAPRSDDFNIVPVVREAIADHADIAARGTNVATYLDQTGMFSDQRNPVVDAMTRKLAEGSKQVRAAFKQFAQDASAAAEGQGSLMGMEPPPAEQAFNDAFGTKLSAEQYAKALDDLRPKQVQAIVEKVAGKNAAPVLEQVNAHLKTGDVEGAEKVLDENAPLTKPNWPPERPAYKGTTNDIREQQPEARGARRLELNDDKATSQEMNWDLERHGWNAESEARREFIARNSTGMTKGELVRAAGGVVPEKPVVYTKTPGVNYSPDDMTAQLKESVKQAKLKRSQK